MTSRRLGWLVHIVVLAVILILAGRVAVPPWETVGDPSVSSVRDRLTALASCVLPATADDPPSMLARVSETMTPGCDASTPDHMSSVWMTAC